MKPDPWFVGWLAALVIPGRMPAPDWLLQLQVATLGANLSGWVKRIGALPIPRSGCIRLP